MEWKFYLGKLLRRTRHTAHVLLEKEGKFLLVQEATSMVRGLWGLPGGGIDAGESIEQTAEREAEEETGFDVELLKDLGDIRDKKRSSVRHVFLGEIKSGELKINEREHMDAGWFNKEEIQSLKLRGDWVTEAINLI
ncbi:NUDIX domain-containing protein [Patescibacteria group bacterium]|nr:NUDIX domain-containing protein [Patescibacteria group bacterium]